MIDIQAQWKRLSDLLFKRQFTSSVSIGLTISNNEVCCVVYNLQDPDNIKCIKSGSVPLQSEKTLSASLLSLQSQMGLSNMKCAWTLSLKDYQLLLIDKPKVMPKEYKAVALWQVKDMLQFPIDDCVVDVFLPSENIVAHKNKLYVVVCKRSYLMSVVEIFSSMNISVESIIIQEFAERNLMMRLGLQEESIALLSQDGETYVLTIFQSDEILFSRRMTKNIDFELMRSFEYFNVTLSQSAIGKLLMYRIAKEEQERLKASLEQSNFIMPVEDMADSYQQFGMDNGEKFSAHGYAVGAALQFLVEIQNG
jgi:hypothetical protein